MEDAITIRHRPDGSIDTAYHMAKGRTCRSEAAHTLAGAVFRAARRSLGGLAALVAVVVIAGGMG